MKGTKLYSIVTGKCPVCHNGDMYITKNSYKISEIFKMHKICPNCDTKFKIEPYFLFGSMHVSYAVGLIFAATTFVISYFILGLNKTTTAIVILISLIGLLPVIARISRNIWMNIFFKYDKSKV